MNMHMNMRCALPSTRCVRHRRGHPQGPGLASGAWPVATGGPSDNRGVSLMEILITMLILAVGVLGIVALQFKGMQFNQDALFRSQINLLAYDLADRMRLNRDNAASYVSGVGAWTVPATAPTACAILTANDMSTDVACWKNQVQAALPAGSSTSLTGSNPYTVTLAWNDREGVSHSVAYTFQL